MPVFAYAITLIGLFVGCASNEPVSDAAPSAEPTSTNSPEQDGGPADPQVPPSPSTDDNGTVPAAPPTDSGNPPNDAGTTANITEPNASPSVLRFVALGDAGRGNNGQYLVADAMTAVCTERGGCDFALMLGDNIYNSGVSSIDDEQWQEKFELPYAQLDFPFYVTLGNHDLGGDGSGNEPSKGDFQVQYAETSEKFRMPSTHYRVVHGWVELVSINTTAMYYEDSLIRSRLLGYRDENEAQRMNLTQWNDAPSAPWRIAFGHHPFLSNGPHGNAGHYDGRVPGLLGSGSALKSFFESHVLGHYDVYLSGHDHSLQDFGATNGTEVMVSGGGATHTGLDGETSSLWQKDRRGFLLLEATESQLTFTFYVVPDSDDPESTWYAAHSRIIVR